MLFKMANKLREGIALGIAGAGLIGLLGGSSPAQACWQGDDPVPSTRTEYPGDIDYHLLEEGMDNGDPMFVQLSRDRYMHATIRFKKKTPHWGAGYIRSTLSLTVREPECNERCFPNGLYFDIRDCDYTGISKEIGYDLTPGYIYRNARRQEGVSVHPLTQGEVLQGAAVDIGSRIQETAAELVAEELGRKWLNDSKRQEWDFKITPADLSQFDKEEYFAKLREEFAGTKTPSSKQGFKAPVAMDFPGRCGEQIAWEVIQEYYAKELPSYHFFPLGCEAGVFVHPNMIDCDRGLQDCWDGGRAREFKKIWKRDKCDPCNPCD